MKMQLKIELSDKTKNEIIDQLSDLKKTYPQFQWEPIKNYSILIHSFGEYSNPKTIVGKLESALFDKNSFYFYSNKINLTIQNSITLFLDFIREKEVEKISESIKEEFQIIQGSEKYVPYLTVANYKIPSKQQYFVIKKRLSKMNIDVSFKINKLSLFEGDKKIHIFKLL